MIFREGNILGPLHYTKTHERPFIAYTERLYRIEIQFLPGKINMKTYIPQTTKQNSENTESLKCLTDVVMKDTSKDSTIIAALNGYDRLKPH